tara:strand:+ start:141 stop:884 length:744 start_codon:yes stop_codon:yes gene_type:complete
MRNIYVIFDLDETLGHFVQLGIINDMIEQYYNQKLSQEAFNKLCDVFIDYFRPGIFLVLRYLKRKKIKNNRIKVVIYTNNNGPKSWAKKLYKYIHYKLNYKLFDQAIGAYKIYNKLIEKNRTTHNKTITDFKSCTKANNNSTFCFIDDQYHPYMENKEVYYIHVAPYVNILNNQLIKEKLYRLRLPEVLINKILTNMNKYNFQYGIIDKVKEKNITKQILLHVQEFLRQSIKTRKNKVIFNKTRKLL